MVGGILMVDTCTGGYKAWKKKWTVFSVSLNPCVRLFFPPCSSPRHCKFYLSNWIKQFIPSKTPFVYMAVHCSIGPRKSANQQEQNCQKRPRITAPLLDIWSDTKHSSLFFRPNRFLDMRIASVQSQEFFNCMFVYFAMIRMIVGVIRSWILLRIRSWEKQLFSVTRDIQKWCSDEGFFFTIFFWRGVADFLGQMEQHTAIHTKGVLDWIKYFIQLDK